MAAHIYTILLEAATCDVFRTRYLQRALGNAPGCDLLDYDDWRRLNDASNLLPAYDDEREDADGLRANLSDVLRGILLELLPRYGQQWLDLGKPESYEAWTVAKHPDSFESWVIKRQIAKDL